MHTEKPEVTTAIILEKRVTRKDKRHPVKLRVTYQRQRKYYTIKGKAFTKTEFNDIMKPQGRGKNKEIRKALEAIENRARKIIDEVLDEFTFEAFEKEYTEHKVKNTSLQSYFEDKENRLKEAEKFQSASLYNTTWKALSKFDSEITFKKITPGYLNKFEKWMLKEGKSYTTIGIYMRNLKHIINLAIKDRVIKQYPFGRDKDKYTIPKGKNTKKALNLDEISQLFNYQPKDPGQQKSLSYWLFSYLCNGMNMTDIANLKYKSIQGNDLVFIRQKTKDSANEIPYIKAFLLPEAWDIINQLGNENKDPETYIFPIYTPEMTTIEKFKKMKQFIKDVNEDMGEIAKDICIDKKVTTYFARHSYSTILKRNGTPVEYISEQLGHQDIKTTKNYLDSFEDEQREKFSRALIPKK